MPRRNYDERSPAQFATLMQTLGVRAPELAAELDVGARSVRDWQRNTPAPDEAWAVIDRQLAVVIEAVQNLLTQKNEGAVVLRTFANDLAAARSGETMTASRHRAMVGHLALALQQAGREWEIVFYPPAGITPH